MFIVAGLGNPGAPYANTRHNVGFDAVDYLAIRPKGSAGTHNGMRSILSRIGTEDFPRVRIGVGKPPAGWQLADYVLSRFSAEERKSVNEVVERVASAIPAILVAGAEAAMTRYNG